MDMRSTLLQRLIQTQIEIFGIDAFWSAFWELCKVDVLYVPEFRQQIIEEGAWRDLILNEMVPQRPPEDEDMPETGEADCHA